jgi:LacI family sucrose operon transcriptional repressor
VNLKLRQEFTEIAEFNIDSGYEKARRLLSGKEHPDCIFCATDNIAAGAMLYCREAGIRIPNDVMIAAVGDSKIGKIAAVPITTAHLHYKTAGSEAAKMLLAAIKEPTLIPRMLQLDYYIIERESTGKAETV